MCIITELNTSLYSVDFNCFDVVYYISDKYELFFPTSTIATLLNTTTDAVYSVQQECMCFFHECTLMDSSGSPVRGQYFGESGFWVVANRIDQTADKYKLLELLMWIGTYAFPSMRFHLTRGRNQEIDRRVLRTMRRKRCAIGLQWPENRNRWRDGCPTVTMNGYSRQLCPVLEFIDGEQQNGLQEKDSWYRRYLTLLRRYVDTDICWSDSVCYLFDNFAHVPAVTATFASASSLPPPSLSKPLNIYAESCAAVGSASSPSPPPSTASTIDTQSCPILASLLSPTPCTSTQHVPASATTTLASSSPLPSLSTTPLTVVYAYPCAASTSVSLPSKPSTLPQHTPAVATTIASVPRWPSNISAQKTFFTLLYHMSVSDLTYIRFIVSRNATAESVRKYQKISGMKLYKNECIVTDVNPRHVLKNLVCDHFLKSEISRVGRQYFTYILHGPQVANIWDFVKLKFGHYRQIALL